MPVPKRKNSKSRRDKRHANKGMDVKIVAVCQTCQAPVSSHQVCKQCGYYKGQKILRTKTDRMHERTQTRQADVAKREAMQTKGTAESEKLDKKVDKK